MITLHEGSAGTGIDYLMSTVISGDQRIRTRDLNAYWSTGGDTPGQWLGAQAAALGISGQVTQEAADAIFKDGINPISGHPLGRSWPRYPTADQRLEQLLAAEPDATEARKLQLEAQAEEAGNSTARAFWEQVYSPVKSWSILWATANDSMRCQLEEVEREAFQRVFKRMEAELCWTRIGPAGVVQVEAQGFIAAAFIHRTSRAGDPDFHRHLAISAKVQTDDGRWLALDARPLMRQTVLLSEMYTTEIERGMAERFGILAAPRADSIRPDKRPIREFLGVDGSMVKLFSQRRQQTERALKDLTADFIAREGRKPSRPEGYALAQAAALAGRPDKRPKSIGAERRTWRRQAWRAGQHRPGSWVKFAQKATRAALADRPEEMPLAEVAARTLEVLESHRDSWTHGNAEAEAYRQLTAAGWHIRAGADFEAMVAALTEHVLNPQRCELITPPDVLTPPPAYQRDDGTSVFVQYGAARYTSHRIKRWEADIVEAAQRPAPVTRLTVEQVDAALADGDQARGFIPSDEQRSAIHRIFTGDTRVKGLIGYAGTGKTTIMALVKEVADRHGIEVLGLANGQVQADELGQAAGIRTENIRRWLVMSQDFARGQRHWTLRRNTIVIVDEAGQASTPDQHALLQQVEAAGGRLLPIGDPRQLGSPGVGGALALLESDTDVIYLTEVRRFRSIGGDLRQWEIDAARAVAHGDPLTSWTAYSARGRLQSGSLDEMLNAAYTAWQRDIHDGLSSILIAPSNALAAQLSDRARTDRVAAGTVDDTRTVTLNDGNRAGVGDRIVTRANDRELRCDDSRQWVRNGDVWTVEAVTDGALLVEHTTTGGRVWIPAVYVSEGGVELGYAITKDRAQGVTVQTGHGLLVEGMDANGAYPELTRGSLTNHGYISTSPQIDPETGEPAAEKTGRQVWSAIVSRDGTQLSATARQRQLWDEAEAIRTHVPRLRYVLDTIADTDAQEAIAALLGPSLGANIAAAPAWPALRAQLLRLADAGYDTDALIVHTSASRAWDGDIDDYAEILHARNRRFIEDEPDRAATFLAPENAPRPTTAATYEEDPQAIGHDVLAALGLRLPNASGEGDDDGDERHVFAHALAEAIQHRADHLADQAHAEAAAGHGWATAYGPEPVPEETDTGDDAPKTTQQGSLAEAVAWHDRIAAAAAFRDLADYTGADPTGPAPTVDDALNRGLWRAAQPAPTDEDAAASAAQAAQDGATWLDVVGVPPTADNPAQAAWTRAAATIEEYRRLWEYGHETVALGERPDEPVQAADYDTAATAIAAYRWVRQYPNLADADPETLALVIARGDAGAQAAEDAAAALAAYLAAQSAHTAAAQAAEDATNRVAAARASDDVDQDPGRVDDLDHEAQRAEFDAARARTEAAIARVRVEVTAPGALAAREAARHAEEARTLLARRAIHGDPDAPSVPPQGDGSPWTDRPHEDLSDTELVNAAARAVDEAVQIDAASRAQATTSAPTAEPAPEMVPEAAELREHAASLRAESRRRALMEPDARAQEATERTRRRAASTEARLNRAYGEHPTVEESRRRPEAPADQPRPATERTSRRPEVPEPAVRNRVEARLNRAYDDRTSPDALAESRRRDPGTPPPPKPDPTPPTTKSAARKPRVDRRLDGAYQRDMDPRTAGSRKGPPPIDRRQPPPPPARPAGPSI